MRERETYTGETLLAGLLVDSFSLSLLYIVQDHLPRDGTTQSGLGPPAPIHNQEIPPQIFPQADMT